MLSADMIQAIFGHFTSLDFWEQYWLQAAVVVTGSTALGWEDDHSDVDLMVLVPHARYNPLYQHYRQAIGEGRVSVMNPRALQHNEFPLACPPGINGHYMMQPFEEIEQQVAQYDDVVRWVHANSVVLHDPSGRYAALQTAASTYPDAVWREKRRHCYLTMVYSGGAMNNPLRRGDRTAVLLTLTDAIARVLRLCCLLGLKPFPYEKWLYRAAGETQAGRVVLPRIDALLEELNHPEIRQTELPPSVLFTPRNADLERFPLYLLWRQVRAAIEEEMAR